MGGQIDTATGRRGIIEIERRGRDIVADRENDKEMIEQLLNFKKKCAALITEAFKNSDAFYEAEKTAFEHCVNVRAKKPAELMAKFIDTQLKSSKLTEDQIDELLTQVIVLFRFIKDKDVFQVGLPCVSIIVSRVSFYTPLHVRHFTKRGLQSVFCWDVPHQLTGSTCLFQSSRPRKVMVFFCAKS